MAIDNKTLKVTIEGDSEGATVAFKNVTKAAKDSGVGLKEIVTSYDAASGTYAHTIQVISAEAQKLSSFMAKTRDKFKSEADIDFKITTKPDTLKLFQETSSKSAEIVRKQWDTIKAIQLNGANSEKAILAKASEEELKIRQEFAIKLAAIEQRVAEKNINRGQAALSQTMAARQASKNLEALYAATSGQVAQTKVQAPTIDWAARKALLDKELAYEASKTAIHYDKQKVKAAEYARDRLAIEQTYAASVRTLNEQVKSNAISASAAQTAHAKALQTYGDSIRKLPSLEEHINQHRGLISVIAQSTAVYRIFSSVWNTVWEGIFSIPKVGIQLEATIASLSSTAGNMQMVQSLMAGISSEAQRTGLNINSLRENFKNFQASTSLAGASLKDTWEMFTNMNTVSVALHHTAAQTQGVFNALAQIFNKSKVQSEELVKQLGNLLPGAFAAFAKSMGISTQKLSEEMKKGAVTAQQTMLQFTRSYAKDFIEAASIASVGFNAELGRMQNSFTNLGEAIYGQTKGPMIDFMQGMSKITNYIAEGIKGNNNFTTSLKEMGNFISSIMIGAFSSLILKYSLLAAEAVSTGTAVKALWAAFTPFTAVTAVVGGLAYIATSIKDIKNASADAILDLNALLQKLGQAKKDSAEVTKLNLSGEQLNAVRELDRAAKLTEEKVKQAQARLSQGGRGAGGADRAKEQKIIEEGMISLQAASEQRFAIISQARRNREATEASKEMEIRLDRMKKGADLEIEVARKLGNTKLADQLEAEKRYGTDLANEKAKRDALLAKQKTTKLSETEDFSLQQSIKDIKNYTVLLENAGKPSKSSQASTSKRELRDSFKDDAREISIATAEIKTQLTALESTYNTNKTSLQSYVGEKKRLLQEQYEKEVTYLAKSRDAAKQAGDVARVSEYTDKIRQASAEHSNRLAEADSKQAAETEKLEEQITNLKVAYDALNGKANTDNKFAELKKNLDSIADPKRRADVEAWLDTVDKTNVALKVTKEAEQDITNVRSIASEEIQRINALKQVGAISELDSMREISRIYEQQIKLTEEKLALAEKALALAPASGEKQQEVERLRRLKVELETLRQTAETVGNGIKRSLGNAFESSFAALLDGTKTGKESFRDFANSVISDMNRMIANELRSKILNPLIEKGIGLVATAASTYFGGGADAFGANSSGRIIQAMANGGVTSGIGAGNGIILDTATYFPNAQPTMMASGGIVAGEAGSEGVLPLARTSSGKLGVRTTGGGETSNGIVIENMSVVVQERKDESSEEQSQRIAQAMREQLLTLIDGRITNARRSGALLNPTRTAATF